MAARLDEPRRDHRVAFRAPWELYQTLREVIGDQPVRLAYDGERIEIMSPGEDHEDFKALMSRLIAALADGLGMRCVSKGSMTWERTESRRGLEADDTFYFSEAKIASARPRPEGALPPIPDLAVEIDTSRPRSDRNETYVALGLTEVWRYDGHAVRFDVLVADGRYTEATESRWLGVTTAEVGALLARPHTDHNDFARQVTAFATQTVRPRRPGWRVP